MHSNCSALAYFKSAFSSCLWMIFESKSKWEVIIFEWGEVGENFMSNAIVYVRLFLFQDSKLDFREISPSSVISKANSINEDSICWTFALSPFTSVGRQGSKSSEIWELECNEFDQRSIV